MNSHNKNTKNFLYTHKSSCNANNDKRKAITKIIYFTNLKYIEIEIKKFV